MHLFGTTKVVPCYEAYKNLKAHDVEAAVDVDGFAGDGGGEWAGEEECCSADFGLIDVAVERGALDLCVAHGAEIADAAGGQRVDGASGDGVDADVFGTELVGEIADGGFERCFGEGHDVVVRDDALRGEVGESEDGAAFCHERGGCAAECD